MKLSSEIKIKLNREHFPNFIFELYRSECEIHRLDLIDTGNNEETYLLEIVYFNREKYLSFIEILSRSREKYNLISEHNAMESKIAGGLLMVRSRTELENSNDYQMNLLGAGALIKQKIESGEGELFSGINSGCAIVCGVTGRMDIDDTRIMELFCDAEIESIVLAKFSGINGFPLITGFSSNDDFVKTLSRLHGGFSCMRLISTDSNDYSLKTRLTDALPVPFLSRHIDEYPIYLLAITLTLIKKYEINPAETTVGFIGIDFSALRCASLLNALGFYRVIGHDINEGLMMEFENQNALATTIDNILINSDILFIIKEDFEADDLQKVRPGQYIISLHEPDPSESKSLTSRGVREHIYASIDNLHLIFPGLIKGMKLAGIKSIDDEMALKISRTVSRLMNPDFTLPDIFSDIHSMVAETI
jgi:hypothetical protein